MIAIIDYGMGNLRSVQKAFEYIGRQAIITNEIDIINTAESIVLPGVGAFGDAMQELTQSKLIQSIKSNINKGKPFLGICLGMQMLFHSSTEDGYHNGLDILDGDIVKFDIDLKVPHIGWNSVKVVKDSLLYKNLPDNNFYFVHSYYLPYDNKNASAICDYGINFACSVEHNKVYGVQFHPEKSGDTGLQMLKNFGEIK